MSPTQQPAEREDPTPEASPQQPAALIDVIRWDLMVLLLAIGALIVNLLVPDALSSALALFLALAVGWVCFRIVVKVREFRAHNRP